MEEERYVDLDDPNNECVEEGEIVEGWRERGSSERRGKGSVFERLGRQAERGEGKEEEVGEGGEEGEIEEMELESSVADVSGTTAQQLQEDSEKSGGREGRRGGVGGRETGEAARDEGNNPLEERIAAEQFERMNDCDLDFGIELNYS